MEEFIFDLLHKPQRDYQKAMKNLQHNGVTDENWAFAYLKESGYWSFKRYGGGGGGANPQAAVGPALNIPIAPVVAHPVQQPPQVQQLPAQTTILQVANINNTNVNNTGAVPASPTKHIFTTDQLGHTISVAHTSGAVVGFEMGKKKAKEAADQKLISSSGLVNYEVDVIGGMKDYYRGQESIVDLLQKKYSGGGEFVLEFPAHKQKQLEIISVDDLLKKGTKNVLPYISRLKSGEMRIQKRITDYDKGLLLHETKVVIKQLPKQK